MERNTLNDNIELIISKVAVLRIFRPVWSKVKLESLLLTNTFKISR